MQEITRREGITPRSSGAVKAIKTARFDRANDIEMSAIISEWLRSREGKVKNSTFQNYTAIVSQYLEPTLGIYRLQELSAAKVNALIEKEIYGSGVSDSRAFDIIAILKSVLQYTADNYGVYISKKNLKYHPKTQKQIERLTPSQQKRLVDVLLDKPDLCRLGVIICLYTGIQVGEICALKWADINLQDKYISIDKTVYRVKNNTPGEPKTVVVIEKPKSESCIRTIPLNSDIARLLAAFGNFPLQSYFLSGTEKFIEPRTYQYKLKNYMELAGISELNFNILRNTFAENCIIAGCGVEALSRMLGHSSVKITRDAYSEIFDRYEKRFSVDLLPDFCRI